MKIHGSNNETSWERDQMTKKFHTFEQKNGKRSSVGRRQASIFPFRRVKGSENQTATMREKGSPILEFTE